MIFSKEKPGTQTRDAVVSAEVTRAVSETALRGMQNAMLPAASTYLMSVEGEDAKLTGMTRSLSRRLLGLNCPDAGLGLQLRNIA